MRFFLILLFFLLGLSTVKSAGIYKWVDEQGNVQFSQTPPRDAESSKVGDATGKATAASVKAVGSCKSLLQLLVGDWRGKDGENRIVYRFYERQKNIGGNRKARGFAIDYGRQSLLQSGFWQLKGTEIIFTIKKLGAGAKKRAPIQRALVAKIEPDNVYLLVGDEKFKLRRYYGAGNHPLCFKHKSR